METGGRDGSGDGRRPRRRLLRVAAIAYTVVIGLVTLTPGAIDPNHRGPIGRLLDLLARHPVTGWLTFDRVEKLANVAMFVPFGFLLALLAGRRRWWVGLITGAVFSCLIEGIQGTLLAATRVADVSDLITNTIGAGIGALVAIAVTTRSGSPEAEIVARQSSVLGADQQDRDG
ncbi:VanZ family protein [Microlunatus soli]|uniref:VanZ like family protein n=1 Tax=Microlunatus soli TaxID=630515 RepID=A0A1H1YTK9_9ACTN|nr:VanZ family protein [Microlunatus soli]SDT24720.1 VanZ like family protein [Microlunatus soli]